MAVLLSPIGGAAAQFFDSNGNPLSGGFIYTYTAGTSTPQATFTTSAGNIQHSNPIQLDAAGRVPSGEIWLTIGQNYKFVIQTSTNVLVGTYDNLFGIIDASNVSYVPPYTSSITTNVQTKLSESVSVKDFGAKGDGITNDTNAIQNALATGKKVYFPFGTYLANIVISGQWFDIYGDGMQKTIIRPYNTSLPAIKNMANPGSSAFWTRSTIKDITLANTGNIGYGFTFGDPSVYTVGDEMIGRVTFTNVEVIGFDKGIFKTCGNIGNDFYNCQLTSNNYNYYAQSSSEANLSAPAMHAGFDSFYDGNIGYSNLAGILIKDSTVLGKGGWTFNGVDIEGNLGYAIAATGTGAYNYSPDITFNECWFEANASTSTSITIDVVGGTTYTAVPVNMYINGITSTVVSNGYVSGLRLRNNSNVIAERCSTDFLYNQFSLDVDASSTFVFDGLQTSVGNNTGGIVFAPYATYVKSTDLTTVSVNEVIPSPISNVVKDATVILGFSGQSYMYDYDGTPGIHGIVDDGMTSSSCNQFVVTNSAPAQTKTGTVTAGKYYAITFQVRLVSGAPATIAFANLTAGIPITNDTWKQYGFVQLCHTTGATSAFINGSSGATSAVNLGAFQIVEFDTAQEAYQYLYKGILATNNDPVSATLPFSAFTNVAAGAYGVTFNSANVSNVVPTSGNIKLFETNFFGDGTAVTVDFLAAFYDFNNPNLAQPSGFTSITFSSLSATPTFTYGASTITFSWQIISGTLYQLNATAAGSQCAIAGIAFIKGH